MTRWGDLDARARGLGARLLDRTALARLAALPDPVALGRALEALWPATAPFREPAREPERIVRRALAARVALLARWAGPRWPAAGIVFEDEERRTVRALVRGAVQGAPARDRLRGLVPTPWLGAEALEAAADAATVEAVVRILDRRGHPWGGALLRRVEAAPFDPFVLEREVDRIFARRARAAARRGDARLAHHVARTIDLENAWTALAAERLAGDADPGGAWLEGGAAIDRAGWEAALGREPAARRRWLAARFGRSPLGRVLGDLSVDASRLEGAALAARIAEERVAARRDPLTTAPFLLYALRLRGEAMDLGRVVWGVALGAPAEVVAAELVAAA